MSELSTHSPRFSRSDFLCIDDWIYGNEDLRRLRSLCVRRNDPPVYDIPPSTHSCTTCLCRDGAPLWNYTRGAFSLARMEVSAPPYLCARGGVCTCGRAGTPAGGRRNFRVRGCMHVGAITARYYGYRTWVSMHVEVYAHPLADGGVSTTWVRNNPVLHGYRTCARGCTGKCGV